MLFNCPQWGIAVNRISIRFFPEYHPKSAYLTVLSCDSLVKVCVPLDTSLVPTRIILLEFYTRSNNKDYIVHLAEVSFYEDSSPCPPFTIIPGNWTPPQGISSCGYIV